MVVKVSNMFNLDIAALRALAVLVVIGYHFFPGYMPWGFVGVDIFFVISGFLIFRILHLDSGLVNFYLNRFRRIYPPLLVLLIIINLLGFFVLFDDELLRLIDSSVASLAQYQNLREMFLGGYFVDAINFRPLLHIWSLSVEYQFYIIFPLFLVIIRRFQLSFSSSLIWLFLTSIVACLLGSLWFDLDVFFVTPLRLWEFLAGAGCYIYTSKKRITDSIRFLLIVASVIFAGLTIYGVRPSLLYPNVWGVFPVIGACCFIIAQPFGSREAPQLKPLLYIASISYSLYLFHFPGIEFLRQIYGPPSISQRLVLLLVVYLAAHFTDVILIPRFLGLRKSTKMIFIISILLLIGMCAIKFFLNVIPRGVIQNNTSVVISKTFQINYREDCKFLGLAPHAEDRCRVTVLENQNPNFVLIGDSLSNSMTTVLDEVGKSMPAYTSYVQIGRGLCPAINGLGDSKCDEFATQSMSYIEQLPTSIPIILAGQWPLYVSKPNFVSSLNDLLVKLTAKGRKVIFAHTVPLGALPRTCLARLPWSKFGDCNIPVVKVLEREQGYKTMVVDVLARNNVIEFEPSKWLCDNNSCSVYANYQILYLDDSHLSKSGGAELGRRSMQWWQDSLINKEK